MKTITKPGKHTEFHLDATIQQILESPAEGQELTICAWVRSRRDSKNISFLNINDGSCVSGLQVVIDQNCREAAGESFAQLLNGASARVSGRLVASQGKGQAAELQATQVELLGAAEQETYPLQKNATALNFCANCPTCAVAATASAQLCECAAD